MKKMKPETQEAFNRFKEISSVEPITARAESGSMRDFVRFRLFWTQELSDFLTVQNFVREKKKNYRGVEITYADCSDSGLGNEWHKHHGFGVHVKWKDLGLEVPVKNKLPL